MKYPLLFSTLLVSLLLVPSKSLVASCYYDNIPPVAVCDAHTVVALGSDGIATVYAYNFDDGSYDNCGISHFKAARMWPGWCPYGVADDTQFRPYVQFCCQDVGSGPIWIIVRVFDHAGNYNECMVTVTVQAGPGGPLHCPPDKYINCDYWFDWNELYNPWNTFFGWPTGGGSGCGGNPNVTVQVFDHTTCGSGYIKRVFSTGGGGYGYGGNKSTCIQIIHINNYHSFGYHDITWPWDYMTDACHGGSVDPNHLPHGYDKPRWTNKPCSQVGYSYKDQVFYFEGGVCTKILRTWTVIDWCKYNPHYPHYGGKWERVQIIKLKDTTKPQFENCVDVTVNGEEEDCKGRFKHNPHVWDNCTPANKLKYEYKIDIYANGSIDIIRTGRTTIDEVLPSGKHKVLWFVDDNCGNTNSCSFFVTVEDKKPPTPICFAQLSTVVMPSSGMVTIWAKDFDASSFDNCTKAHQLRYSFSPNVHEGSRTFTCDDLGLNALRIYVTDLAGNQAFCNVFLTIDDNESVCENMNPITGNVETFSSDAVSGASVLMHKIMPNGDMVVDMNRISDSHGGYKVGFGTTQYNRMIEVKKEAETMAGITTLDLVYLQQHIMGVAPITHPAALMAADLDGSGRAGVNDLLMLRDAVLSGGKSLRGKGLPWYFYPSDCEWNNGAPVCKYSVEINHTQPPTYPLDFIGYKMGDVNGDIMEDPSQRNVARFPVGVFYDKTVGAFAFTALEDATVFGMQLSFNTALQVNASAPMAGGMMNVSAQNCYYDRTDRIVNLSWTTPFAQKFEKGDVLFFMTAPEHQAAMGNEALLWKTGIYRNEIYMTDRTAMPVELRRIDQPQTTGYGQVAIGGETPGADQITFRSGNGLNGFDNLVEGQTFFAPNPMVDAGLLYFVLPTQMEVTLEVFGSDNRTVVSRKIHAAKGLNEAMITARELGSTGMFLYRISAGEDTFTGKIVSVR